MLDAFPEGMFLFMSISSVVYSVAHVQIRVHSIELYKYNLLACWGLTNGGSGVKLWNFLHLLAPGRWYSERGPRTLLYFDNDVIIWQSLCA